MVRSALWMFYFIFGICIIFFNSKKEQYKYILGTLLLLWSFDFIKDAVSQYCLLLSSDYIRHLYLLFDIIAIPLCAFYLLTMTYKHWLTLSRAVLSFLPFLCGFFAYMFLPSQRMFLVALIAVPMLYAFFMVPYILRGLRRYSKAIDDNYSYRDRIDIQWLKTVVWLLVVNLVFCIFLYSHISMLYLMIYYLYSMGMWLYIIIRDYKYERPKWIPEPDPDSCAGKQEEPKEPCRCNQACGSLAGRLEKYFTDERVFLKSDLTVQNVAVELGTNRTYLSQCLNHELNTTFFDYVNGFRLEHACNLLKTTDMNIMNIAEESGFEYFSSFYRVFKKAYGCTPKEYREANR